MFHTTEEGVDHDLEDAQRFYRKHGCIYAPLFYSTLDFGACGPIGWRVLKAGLMLSKWTWEGDRATE